MYGLAVYVKEGRSFAQDLSLENSANSYLCFRMALLHLVSYFFCLYWSPSSSLCAFFDSISSNMDEVLSITHLLMFLSLETLMPIIRAGLPILVELIDLANFVIIFLSQMTLLRCLTFLLGSQTVILIVLLFWISFFPLHVVVSVSIDFPSNSQGDAPLHRIAYDYSCADWDSLHDLLRDVPWEDIFKLGVSAAASKFCEWVQFGTDVSIPHRKYQVKPHSSPWSSAACAAVIVHRNHFFWF